MSDHGLHNTTDLVPLLADRSVVMTSTQVYRIVSGEPERLNMRLMAALCDIFVCTPNDLIEPYVVSTSRRGRKTVTAAQPTTRDTTSKTRPGRAYITQDRSRQRQKYT